MDFYWTAVLLLSAGITFRESNGLKCYICDSGMEGCQYLINSPKSPGYLQDCGTTAVACAAFTVETQDFSLEFERWFQRICLYPTDLGCFALNSHPLGSAEALLNTEYGFADQVKYANNERKKQSLPEITELSESSHLRSWEAPFINIQTCVGRDGCNEWPAVPIFPYAEGYPVEEYEDKKVRNMLCYACTDLPHISEACRQGQTATSHWRKEQTNEAYGCAMLSIYQIVGGMKPFFERALWFPGDHWCIQKKYDNARAGGRFVNYSTSETGCKERLARVVKERNSGKQTISWTGQREFHSVKEFADFVKCKEQVRNRLGVSKGVFNFDEAAAIKEYSGKSGHFASVGFHLCSPTSLCNGYSQEELQGGMKKGFLPSTTPETTTDPSSSTTPGNTGTAPTPTNPTGGDEIPDGGCNGDDEKGGATSNLFHGKILCITAVSTLLAVY